jgi:hypothetical protein
VGPVERDFSDVLRRLFELWAGGAHPQSNAEFIEYLPHDIGEPRNPKVRFRIDGKEQIFTIERLIREIWGRINSEKEASGQRVTRK